MCPLEEFRICPHLCQEFNQKGLSRIYSLFNEPLSYLLIMCTMSMHRATLLHQEDLESLSRLIPSTLMAMLPVPLVQVILGVIYGCCRQAGAVVIRLA